MKKQYFLLTVLFLTGLLFIASCSTDEKVAEPDIPDCNKIEISGEISQTYATRVNDSGFCDGDAVGIYITDYNGSVSTALQNTGNRADNVKHVFNESTNKWIPTRDIYWKDKNTHIDIYGYYPFASPTEVDSYLFEVGKDQNRAAESGRIGGYEASDFLWGKAENIAPTDKVIKLGFNHKLANVRVSLAEGTGFETGEWASLDKQVLVSSTVRKAEIDLSTGIAEPAGTMPATDIIPLRIGEDYRAIVVPQEIAADMPLLAISVGGSNYCFKKDAAFTYTASKQHNFTITVNKKAGTGEMEFIMASESITAWENDDVSHSGEARTYVVINATPGALKDSIKAMKKDYGMLKNLKVIGSIDARDFYFMRDSMAKLQALNLKEVEIAGVNISYSSHKAKSIPNYAMNGKTSLLRLVLPDNITRIEERAFGSTNLTGSLIIPEGVTYVGPCAFSDCKNMLGTLSLPSTLDTIAEGAFINCGFFCELSLPQNLKYLGGDAFGGCHNLYGNLYLPQNIKEIKNLTFYSCSELNTSIIIPEGVTKIGESAFYDTYMKGSLQLPESLEHIGEEAFCNASLTGELILPKNLTVIPDRCFSNNNFSGELKIPNIVTIIGASAFSGNNLSGTLVIPKDIMTIGNGAFGYNKFDRIVIEKGIDNIGAAAFDSFGCSTIKNVVSKNPAPPHITSTTFQSVDKDKCILEVPEGTVNLYQTAIGWCDFKHIIPYHSLEAVPKSASAINASTTRNVVLNAESVWSVEKKPEWITLSSMNGTGRTELTLTFEELTAGSADRSDTVVFKLDGKDYRCNFPVAQYNYEHTDDEVIELQKDSIGGNGVDVVIIGDGYDAKDISSGQYLTDIRAAVNHLFSIEPFKSYRKYFNVFTSIATSPQSGIGGVNTIIDNKFNTAANRNAVLGGRNGILDDEAIFEYICRIFAEKGITEEKIKNCLISIIPNTKDYGGITYLYNDGSAIAYCPLSDKAYPNDFRGIVQREMGGHAFGKFADEHVSYNGFINDNASLVEELREGWRKGWFTNLSMTGKRDEVPWSHLFSEEKYKNMIDIFEGGYSYSKGVFRSETNSCMNNNISYFSTICRETIVKLIKKIAGETYDFADFLAKDVTDAGPVSSPSQASTDSGAPAFISSSPLVHNAPVMRGERPVLNVK